MWEVVLLGLERDALVARLSSFDAADRLCSRLCSRLPMGAVDCVVMKRAV